MNVNKKGSLGLVEVMRDLSRKEIECFLPIHDYSAVDLIAMHNYNVYRLQVKYRETFRGMIEIPFKTVVNGKSVPIDFNAIDGWAVFCPEVDKVIYISKSEVDLTKGSVTFRLTPSKNRNSTGNARKMYTDFSEMAEWPKASVC